MDLFCRAKALGFHSEESKTIGRLILESNMAEVDVYNAVRRGLDGKANAKETSYGLSQQSRQEIMNS